MREYRIEEKKVTERGMERCKESLLKIQAGRDGKVNGGREEGRESGIQPVFMPQRAAASLSPSFSFLLDLVPVKQISCAHRTSRL